MSFLDFVLACVIYLVASFWACYGIIPLVITLRVGIPVTLALEQVVRIDGETIRKKYKFTLWFWGIIDTVIILLIVMFGGGLLKIIVCISVLLVLLRGLKQTGINKENISDYYQSNKQFIAEEDLEQAQATLLRMMG